LAPRTLLRFLATPDPAATLSSSADFPVFPVIRLPCSADFATGREGFSSCLACPCHRAVPTTPPKLPAASVSCDDPCCLRLKGEGSTFGVILFSRPSMGSPSLRPDDWLTILTMALSIGFRSSISFLSAIQATGLLTITPVGLPPTEHASLRWTHPLTQKVIFSL
jgi:hypothetical protein